MLGKLSRWLRILGHDVRYSNKLDDARLITTARREKRVLLTRDFELYKQATTKGIDTLYLEGQTGEEKLAELAERFGIDLNVDMTISRCPKCNMKVKPLSKERVQDRVEENTFLHYDAFWECPKCRQIYWQGAHWAKIRKTLKNARESLKKR
jgi:hypothetical protein